MAKKRNNNKVLIDQKDETIVNMYVPGSIVSKLWKKN